MSELLTEELGIPEIERATLDLLLDNLNDVLEAEDILQEANDKELARKQCIKYQEVVSEPVKPENFYQGHRPSLIEAPPEEYPNISVMAFNGGISSDIGDQYFNHDMTIFIESMLKEGPYKSSNQLDRMAEDSINKKSNRMIESINKVILDNQTLGGIVFEIPVVAPNWERSNAMKRREVAGHKHDFYWQMIRLEYTIVKLTSY